MSWKSIAIWPPGTCHNAMGSDESDDLHDTEEQALAICRMLRRHGFGGDGNVFPISTRVEEVKL